MQYSPHELSPNARSKYAAPKLTIQETSWKNMELHVGFMWNQDTGRLHTYSK